MQFSNNIDMSNNDVTYQKANTDFSIKELENTTLIKTFLMIIIVLYHSLCFLGGNWFTVVQIQEKPFWASYVIQWINSFSIYAFTMISGYIFCYIKNEKNGYQKFFPFLWTKTKRLLIPYVFVCAIWVVPIYIFFFNPNVNEIIRKFVLGEGPNQLWFLLMLFWVFMLSFPLVKLFNKRPILSIIVVLGLYCIGLFGLIYIKKDCFQIFTACKYVSFFFLGYKLRSGWSERVQKLPFWFWIILDIVVFIGYLYVNTQNGKLWILISLCTSFVLNLIGSLMVWTTFQFIANHSKLNNSKIMNFLGRRSMIVYLFHQQIIYFCIFLLNGKINIYLNSFINFIVSFSLSVLLATLLLKCKFTRFFVGEK